LVNLDKIQSLTFPSKF